MSLVPFKPVLVQGLDPPLGSALGPYQLEAVLGEGTMGRVYLGRHQALGRAVALKVLHADFTQDVALLRRFFLEARMVAQINHQHIVEVYDFVEEQAPHYAYCVMELLTGETLAERVLRAPLTIERSLHVIRQIAEALSAAHAVGVVHRDLKPDNIFLVHTPETTDFVKVLDFGVAKLLATATTIGANDTQSGALIGTPRYMSPEQAAGLVVDHRADIYALGTVLYELLCGHVPFEAEAFGQLAAEIITQQPPPMLDVTRSHEPLPPALRELTLRCLAKQPADRFSSMTELLAALDHPPPPRRRTRRWLALGGASAALALLTFGSMARHPMAAPAPVLPVPPVAAVAAVVEAIASVTVMVVTLPPGATVTRTDTNALLGQTPLELRLPKSHEPTTLRITLAGYQPLTRVTTFDSNQRLEFALTPLPLRPPPRAPRPVREGVLEAF
jgi:serine/threonine protein kinase